MIALLLAALKGAIVQIILAILTTETMKKLILVALQKLAAHTDNEVDDKIISIVDDAIHGREPSNDSQVCSKCKAVLDKPDTL